MADISLFDLVMPDQDQDAFVNTVDMMLKISYQIEDIVIDNELPVDFYAGFQRVSYFSYQTQRYQRLADVARRVFVFGEPDITPPLIPGVQFVPLAPGAALTLEWFLVVNTPTFFTALLTQEIPGADPIRGDRRFRGIWTYDENVVNNAHLLITQALRQPYRPVTNRDYKAQNRFLVRMSNKLVQYSEAANLSRAQSESGLGVLSQVAQEVGAGDNLDRSLQAIVTALRPTFQARTVRLYLPNGDGLLHLKAAAALDAPANIAHTVPAGQGSAGEALTERRPIVVTDTVEMGETDPLDPAVRSLATVPLLAGERRLGVLMVGRDLVNAFDDTALLLLRAVAGQVSLALEREELTSAQQKIELLLNSILTGAQDGIIVTDAAGRIAQINAPAAAALGVQAAEVRGRPLTVLQNAPLNDLCQELQTRGGDSYQEIPLAGDQTALGGASLVRDARGAPLGWVIVLHLVNAGQSSSRGETDPRTGAHTRPLIALPETAAASFPLDYDLDNRLRTISGLTALLPARIALDEDQTRYVSQIIKLTRETARMVNNLVYLNQLDATSNLDTATLPLNTLVSEVVEKFRPVAIRKGVTLTLDTTGDVSARINTTAVQRAAQNLVENALKYTPAGGSVQVRLAGTPAEARISVTDTGIGLWPRDLGLVFNRFYRVVNQQNQDIPSAGLGLAVVKAVAERHGGRAWVESTLGQGSTFSLALPAT